MKIEHEAILSLNTRVRRLRYLFKVIELVAAAPISRALLLQQLIEYAYSKQLYDEVTNSTSEPYSGHFFENVSRSFDNNQEKRAHRSANSALRVADGYVKLAAHLGLIAETEYMVSGSQMSLPMRFVDTYTLLSVEARLCARNSLVLALLLKCDRDLTCPFLEHLASRESGLLTSEIEMEWDTWSQKWLEKIIQTASSSGLGNPRELLRYSMTVPHSRKNPRSYAEHIALIRFHWLLDLGIVVGEPVHNPVHFALKPEMRAAVERLLGRPENELIEGNVAAIHFEMVFAYKRSVTGIHSQSDLRYIVRQFLEMAQRRGLSNLRLSLLDIVVASFSSAEGIPPPSFAVLCAHIDEVLRSEGLIVVRAPRRDETYIPTKQ